MLGGELEKNLKKVLDNNTAQLYIIIKLKNILDILKKNLHL